MDVVVGASFVLFPADADKPGLQVAFKVQMAYQVGLVLVGLVALVAWASALLVWLVPYKKNCSKPSTLEFH